MAKTTKIDLDTTSFIKALDDAVDKLTSFDTAVDSNVKILNKLDAALNKLHAAAGKNTKSKKENTAAVDANNAAFKNSTGPITAVTNATNANTNANNANAASATKAATATKGQAAAKKQLAEAWAKDINARFSNISNADIDTQVKFHNAIGKVQELISKGFKVDEANKIFSDLQENIANTYTKIPRHVQNTLNDARSAYAKYRTDVISDLSKFQSTDAARQLVFGAVPTGIAASRSELEAFAKAKNAVLTTLSKGTITDSNLIDIFDEVQLNNLKEYSGDLAKLQEHLVKYYDTYNKLGAASRKNPPLPSNLATKADVDAYFRRLNIPTGLNASREERGALVKAQGAVYDFLASNKTVSGTQVGSLLDEVADPTKLKIYTGELKVLQERLLAVARAYSNLGKSKAASAASPAYDPTATIGLLETAQKSISNFDSALLKDRLALSSAQAALLDFVKKHQIAQDDIDRIWSEVNRGHITRYTGHLNTLQGLVGRVTKAMDELDSSTTKFSNHLASANVFDKLDTLYKNIENVTAGAPASKKEEANFSRAANALKAYAQKSKLTVDEINEVWESVASNKAVNYHRRDLAELQVLIGEVQTKYKDLGKEARAQQRALTELNFSWQTMFRLMVTQVAAQAFGKVTQGINDALSRAIELNRQITNIQNIDLSKLPFKSIESKLFGLSTKYGIDVLEEAGGAYQSISNQIGNAAESLEFLDKANKYALVTATNQAAAVDALSAAYHAYGGSLSDVDEYAAVFAKTIDLGKISPEELPNNIGRLLVPAAQLGVKFKEINAAMAAMTISGINMDVASTLLRNVMMGLIKPSKDLAAVIKDEWNYNTGQAAVLGETFSGVLKKIADGYAGNQEMLAKLFPDMREFQGITVFTGQGLLKYNEALAANANAYEGYQEKLNRALTAVSKEYDILKATWVKLFTEDATTLFIDWLAKTTDGFDKITPKVETFNKALGLIAGSLGLLVGVGIEKGLFALGGVVAAFAELHPVILALTAIGGIAGIASAFDIIDKNVAYSKITDAQSKIDAAKKERTKYVDKYANSITSNADTFTREGIKALADNAPTAVKSNLSDIQADLSEAINRYVADVHDQYKAAFKLANKKEKKQKEDLSDVDTQLLGVGQLSQAKLLSLEVRNLKQRLDEAAKAGDSITFEKTKRAFDEITNKYLATIDKIENPLQLVDQKLSEINKERSTLATKYSRGELSYDDFKSADSALVAKRSRIEAMRGENYSPIDASLKENANAIEAATTEEERGRLREARKILEQSKIEEQLKKNNLYSKQAELAYQADQLDPEDLAGYEELLKQHEAITAELKKQNVENVKAAMLLEERGSIAKQQQTVFQDNFGKVDLSLLSEKKKDQAALASAIKNFDWDKARSPEVFAHAVDRQLDSMIKLEKLTKELSPNTDTTDLAIAIDRLTNERQSVLDKNETLYKETLLQEIKSRIESSAKAYTSDIQNADDRRASIESATSNLNVLASERKLGYFTELAGRRHDLSLREKIETYRYGPAISEMTKGTNTSFQQLNNVIDALNTYNRDKTAEHLDNLVRKLDAIDLVQPASSNKDATIIYDSLKTIKDAVKDGSLQGSYSSTSRLQTLDTYTQSLKGIDIQRATTEQLENILKNIPAKQNVTPTKPEPTAQSNTNSFVFNMELNGINNPDLPGLSKKLARYVFREIQNAQANGTYTAIG